MLPHLVGKLPVFMKNKVADSQNKVADYNDVGLCCKNLRRRLWVCNLTYLFSLDSHSK
jgi:hypothetical protein